MQAEIITIGDEILIGQIIDTNSAWMGQQLNLIGIEVARISSISDTENAIVDALDNLYPETKLVLMTGGLGPTKDDLTKHTLTDYFNTKLVYHEEVYEHITQLFAAIGRVPAAVNKEQALLPENCRVLPNAVGTAAGMLFQKDGKYIVSMPGVPFEMKHIMSTSVLPIVTKELIRKHIFHRTILTVGVPESELAESLNEFEDALPAMIKLAYLPRPGMVRLRLTARGDSEAELRIAIELQISTMRAVLGDVVYGAEQDSLEQIVGDLLAEQGDTIATAESCTGGYLAHKLTSIAGSSRYFMGSVVAYDNAVKMNQLGVSEQSLATEGAVSERVIREMAEGVRKKLNTTWALATSGIAGPDGGTDEKPVGTVWIALAGKDITIAHKYQFGNDRGRNIRKSTFAALDLLRKILLKKEVG